MPVIANVGLLVLRPEIGSPSEGVWYVPPAGRPRQLGLRGRRLYSGLGIQLYEADITSPGAGRVSLLEGHRTRLRSPKQPISAPTSGPRSGAAACSYTRQGPDLALHAAAIPTLRDVSEITITKPAIRRPLA